MQYIKNTILSQKYYVQGFDGEHIRTSLTKDEIKDRFERDTPPTESEFQTEEYMEHRRKVDSTYPQFIHGIPWMAKEQGVQLQTEQSGETLTIPWEEDNDNPYICQHVKKGLE